MSCLLMYLSNIFLCRQKNLVIVALTLKHPPIYNVSGGPKIATSHSKRLSSFTSLTRKPSTGSSCKLLYSTAKARNALLFTFGAAISHNHQDCSINELIVTKQRFHQNYDSIFDPQINSNDAINTAKLK